MVDFWLRAVDLLSTSACNHVTTDVLQCEGRSFFLNLRTDRTQKDPKKRKITTSVFGCDGERLASPSA